MGMRRRKQAAEQELWIATDQLARAPGHVFYRKLNQLLAKEGFDRFIEDRCQRFYDATGNGRPSIAPGVYFRMLFVGYFEGLNTQRGIAWRCADSLSLREFLGLPLSEETPDHSSLTRIRQRLPQEIHDEMFLWVIALAAKHKLLSGKSVGVDSTTLEANAAMKSIVRKDTGEDYKQYLTRLAEEAGTRSRPTRIFVVSTRNALEKPPRTRIGKAPPIPTPRSPR